MTRHYLTSSAPQSVYICLVYSHLQYAITVVHEDQCQKIS